MAAVYMVQNVTKSANITDAATTFISTIVAIHDIIESGQWNGTIHWAQLAHIFDNFTALYNVIVATAPSIAAAIQGPIAHNSNNAGISTAWASAADFITVIQTISARIDQEMLNSADGHAAVARLNNTVNAIAVAGKNNATVDEKMPALFAFFGLFGNANCYG